MNPGKQFNKEDKEGRPRCPPSRNSSSRRTFKPSISSQDKVCSPKVCAEMAQDVYSRSTTSASFHTQNQQKHMGQEVVLLPNVAYQAV